jgi:hypothetical protein
MRDAVFANLGVGERRGIWSCHVRRDRGATGSACLARGMRHLLGEPAGSRRAAGRVLSLDPSAAHARSPVIADYECLTIAHTTLYVGVSHTLYLIVCLGCSSEVAGCVESAIMATRGVEADGEEGNHG